MSDMEQQMQSYIEGGLSEADRCYTRIAELEQQNAELAAQLKELQQERDQLAAQVGQSEQQWQPIATAPKDGTMILGYMPSSCHEGLVCVCYWNAIWEHWQNNTDGGSEKPSHWLKLPEPPIRSEAAE